jgi:hypothetical protein
MSDRDDEPAAQQPHPVESGHGKQRIEDNLSRSDFEEEFALAQAEKRAPKLISVRAIGVDLSGLDFNSGYQSPYGPHSGVYLNIDLRGAKLKNCILERCGFGSSNLRGADLSNSNLRGVACTARSWNLLICKVRICLMQMCCSSNALVSRSAFLRVSLQWVNQTIPRSEAVRDVRE